MTLKDMKAKCEELRKNGANDGHYIMFRLADVEEVIREAENGPAKEEKTKEESEAETESEPENEPAVSTEPAEGEREDPDQLFREQDIL